MLGQPMTELFKNIVKNSNFTKNEQFQFALRPDQITVLGHGYE